MHEPACRSPVQGVFRHDSEARTSHSLFDAQSASNALGKERLPGTHIAMKGDGGSAGKLPAKVVGDLLCLFRRGSTMRRRQGSFLSRSR